MAKKTETSQVVRLQLTCIKPPLSTSNTAEVEFGLQDRNQVIHPGRVQDDGSLLYEIDVAAVRQGGSQEIRLRGPYVHGTPAAPFLYLSMRRRDADPGAWIRRLKIPLPDIEWEQMEGEPRFAASISGEGSGTVPLLGEGWTRQDFVSAGFRE